MVVILGVDVDPVLNQQTDHTLVALRSRLLESVPIVVVTGIYVGPMLNQQVNPMIPPVRTDPVWGRARSGPVPPEGQTGPSPRLAVLDWTGLVWTSPNRI